MTSPDENDNAAGLVARNPQGDNAAPLSITEISDPLHLQIEVKASERPISFADFHVTRNEWEVAQTSERYVFHLWSLAAPGKRLAVLSPEQVASHIPTENGKGRWETVAIPFNAFGNDFRAVS